jgi:hypothetical protein
MLLSSRVQAQVPPGCTGNGQLSAINFLPGGNPPPVSTLKVHVGDTIFYQLQLGVPGTACQASNVNAFIKFPDGTVVQFLSGATVFQGDTITCPGDPRCINTNLYHYTVRAQDIGANFTLSVPSPLNGVTNTCSSATAPNEVGVVLNAVGISLTDPAGKTYSSCNNLGATVLIPGIACTKSCVNGIGQNGSITFSGSVTNNGNTRLLNVSVSNLVNGASSLVTNISSLNPGQSVSFAGSYVPANVCAPVTDIITVRGTDDLGSNVTSTCSATCSNILTPCLTVTKSCPGPVVVGSPQTISGVVSNCGNVTITNIILTDNILGPVTNFATLPPGTSASYSLTFTAGCVGNTNTVTARGTTICGQGITNTATAPCLVTENPCIAVTKNCNPPVVQAGGVVTFSGVVTNCGDIALTNVVLTDTFLNKVIAVFPLLAKGGAAGSSQPYSTNYTTTQADCARSQPINNTVIAVGRDFCNTRNVTNTASCTFRVECPPCIDVTKQIACFSGTNAQGAELCGTFGKIATGVQGDTQNPAFCYRITVTNCSTTVALTNVTIIDDKYGDLTSHFTGINPFPPGGTATFTFKVELDGASPPSTVSLVTNTVVASGKSALTGQTVSDQDQAVAKIIPAAITCTKCYTVDGGPCTNGVTLDNTPHTIVWYVTVKNTGLAGLGNIVLTDTSALCNAAPAPFSLAPGASTTIALCTNANFVCTNSTGLLNTVAIVANQFSYTNVTELCGKDTAGVQITVRTECEARIFCSVPNACRVTGGGRQDDPLVYPANVRYVTHGGQVGAPVGARICTVTTNFTLGNPCIHGRWTHVRHMQGGLEGNFHARFYDTLECACLDTNVGPGGVYGAGTVIDGICNPDDHKVAGPQPRPAPANKIVFTGVGDWADPNGRRAPRSTLFRVDIEDRSEPGGSHPKGAVPPADRYRIRIWVLSESETAQLNGAGPDKWLLNFRNAISACNGTNVRDGADVDNGIAVFGVRAPDIDDGGELERGNHQIHPSIMACDPFNPVGPGLPKP